MQGIRHNLECRRLAYLWLLALPLSTTHAADTPPPAQRPLTSIERMSEPHLAATDADVKRLAQERQEVPPLPGLTDFRAVFHVHAEDSAHTGGTLPELLQAARSVGVQAIFLADHDRPPRDSFTASYHGLKDGVLFVPGNEMRGFLVLPTRSILAVGEAPEAEFINFVRGQDGLAFLSHIEERADHSLDNLDGLEIVNRHYDAIRDKIGLAALMLRLTDPDSLASLERAVRDHPHALFGFQDGESPIYLRTWDAGTRTRRLTGVGANDCHHNNTLIVKMIDADHALLGVTVDRDDQMEKVPVALRPGLRKMMEGHKPGDIIARVDVDPYPVGLLAVCTHILAGKLDEPTLRAAVREGRVYVSRDWMADPTGFRYTLVKPEKGPEPVALMGDERRFELNCSLRVESPVPASLRLLRDGKEIAATDGRLLEYAVKEPGVYRVEAWLTLDREPRPWIYSNPIYLRTEDPAKP